MSISAYLETAPLYEVVKYQRAIPKDAVSFVGSPRKHPYEEGKLILILDPRLEPPAIIEFKLSDIAAAEELASPVTERGEGVRMVKLWVRHGAMGVIHEPFEVKDGVQFAESSAELRERMIRSFS